MSQKVTPSRYTRVLGSRKTMVAVHDRKIADVRKDPAVSLLVLDCEAGASELLHLLLVGKELLGHRRSSRIVKGEPAGPPPVPGIESFWTLITTIMLSANLRAIKTMSQLSTTDSEAMHAGAQAPERVPDQYDLWCQIDLHPSKLRTRNLSIAFTACRQIAKQH